MLSMEHSKRYRHLLHSMFNANGMSRIASIRSNKENILSTHSIAIKVTR